MERTYSPALRNGKNVDPHLGFIRPLRWFHHPFKSEDAGRYLLPAKEKLDCLLGEQGLAQAFRSGPSFCRVSIKAQPMVGWPARPILSRLFVELRSPVTVVTTS